MGPSPAAAAAAPSYASAPAPNPNGAVKVGTPVKDSYAMGPSPTAQSYAFAPAPNPNGAVQKVVLGPENTVTTCPFCNASIKTAVKYTTTTRTHMTAILGCLCCCCCIGYCLDSAKNSDHYCPNCSRYLGTYEK